MARLIGQPIDRIDGRAKVMGAALYAADHRAAEMAVGTLVTSTVACGRILGIDTAAHLAALEAGGRTVAVIGTGINKTYPAANRDLHRVIAKEGLLLSQFWPDAPPQKHPS